MRPRVTHPAAVRNVSPDDTGAARVLRWRASLPSLHQPLASCARYAQNMSAIAAE